MHHYRLFSLTGQIYIQEPNLFVGSVDLYFLFTNTPIDETINTCIDDLLNNNKYLRTQDTKDNDVGLFKVTTKDLF